MRELEESFSAELESAAALAVDSCIYADHLSISPVRVSKNNG